MKCSKCGFELPEDWRTPIGFNAILCVPCQHVSRNIGISRTDIMTPWEHK